MKQFLASSAILALTAGFAAAEVKISGSARMGLIDDYGDVGVLMTSRVRVTFDMSGETDTGLSFGASVRADQSGQGNTANDDSTVYISGAFGKLSMGDVDGAAAAAVGQVSGVGLTGLGDYNEIAYILGEEDTSALYEYSTGGFAFYLSAQPNGGNSNYGLGASYTVGDYKFAIGYESVEDDSTPGSAWPDKIGFSPFWGNGATQVVLGADATFGPVTGKLRFARYSEDNIDAGLDQTALSVDYAVDALTLTAFYSNFRGTDAYEGDDADFYGLGASYDLGGGASVAAGYSRIDYGADPTSAVDLGLSFKF
ncbi:porin [Tabrizicola flagellatus]|uniref:porin n=1 Tax=Tabrizicola flagellatus TaxID=2593021 RepID=UPI0011F27357|nr:porin [Tabrizicola flagellatus]